MRLDLLPKDLGIINQFNRLKMFEKLYKYLSNYWVIKFVLILCTWPLWNKYRMLHDKCAYGIYARVVDTKTSA